MIETGNDIFRTPHDDEIEARQLERQEKRAKSRKNRKAGEKIIKLVLAGVILAGGGKFAADTITAKVEAEGDLTPKERAERFYENHPDYSSNEVMVQKGDTLWVIAKDAVGEDRMDVRDEVMAIEDINGLDDPIIQPGQVLEVPTYDGEEGHES
ncbi:MAG: LysM peptidoglycan-binding domain-containing protein [Candidatus Nomurabacteria bacterium]|jgi:nucleoid-associated protein YgaU|nr:LysM peptidoglycan-binding domain-containing protein [Candidatus Nomurabacteria bacterium]